MVDRNKKKQNERRTSRSGCQMNYSNKLNSHQSTELVAYHKVKHIFLNLADIDKEDPSQLVMCEFKGQDFQLLID